VERSFTFPVLIPYSQILTYVTLSIPNGDEKSNLICISNEFGYPRPILIPALDKKNSIKKEVFFIPGLNVVIHYPAKR